MSQRRFGATDGAEAKKHKKYSEEVKKVGGRFVAFNLETYGAFGNGADRLVSQILAAHQPEFASAPAATVRRLLTRRVACAIHSMNAVAIQEWLNTANVLSEPTGVKLKRRTEWLALSLRTTGRLQMLKCLFLPPSLLSFSLPL